jgi:S1-C subfamily serine protease
MNDAGEGLGGGTGTHSHRAGARPVPVIVHLSGAHRGVREPLTADTIRLGTSADADIHFPADREPAVADNHMILRREGDAFRIEAWPGQWVAVNGEVVDEVVLETEDVIEVGRGGPLLRYRRYRPSALQYKSMREAVHDCVDCARHARGGRLGKAGSFVAGLPRELFTQTSPWSRALFLALFVLLVGATGTLAVWGMRLNQRLERAESFYQVDGAVEGTGSGTLTATDLLELQAEIEDRLSGAVERVEALEARSDAGRRVIGEAASSVVFIQAAYGFNEPDTGRPIRILLGADGAPLGGPSGRPVLTADGSGPIYQILITGTAFIATPEGLILTNRHIALPWDYDPVAEPLLRRGLDPVMHRMVGYLPGIEAGFPVEMLAVSDRADVAVLQCSVETVDLVALELSEVPPAPGDEVYVLGYPTGIRALIARTDPAFVDSLRAGGGSDFWSVAESLSRSGHIAPLATQGIVGQVSRARVVYDAETTHGGSGGPVLGMDGRVVAINAAILDEQFGGSNLGVPAAEARRLLSSMTETQPPTD